MRHRRSAALVAAVAALALLGTSACGDDSDDGKPAFVPPSGSASAPAAGATSAAPGTSAAPTTGTPTEGTSSRKPPKKGEANQGPVGRHGG